MPKRYETKRDLQAWLEEKINHLVEEEAKKQIELEEGYESPKTQSMLRAE